jgi:aspartyl-tRNA synthetase
MLLAGTPSIRDVITFPKTQSGADPLTGAPTPIPADQLAEVRLRPITDPTSRPISERKPGPAPGQ